MRVCVPFWGSLCEELAPAVDTTGIEAVKIEELEKIDAILQEDAEDGC